MEKITVLVVEDEMKLLGTLSDFLVINNYKVYQAADGLNAIQEYNTHREEIDIVLLDVMLPFLDGYEVLKQIRLTSNVPVIMLTAKEEVDDQLKGFSCGADDYIIKPYTLSVLKMHMEAVLKRLGYGQDILHVGNIRIEINAKKVYVEDQYVETTPKEFELLYLLARNQGKVLTRDFILDNIWGYHYAGDMRTIDTLVKQLRKKLGKVPYIRTVYGVGYCFEGDGNEKTH